MNFDELQKTGLHGPYARPGLDRLLDQIAFGDSWRWYSLADFPVSPYHYSPYPAHTFYRAEWRGPRMPPAAINVKWPWVQLDDDGEEWARLTSFDWLAMYPDHYWREASALGLVVLAQTIAANANKRQWLEGKFDAGGADLFSRGLLAIVENMDKDLPARVWGLRIARGMYERKPKHKTYTVDWARTEELADCQAASKVGDEIRAACRKVQRHVQWQVRRSLTDAAEPWQDASKAEQEERTQAAWESCLSDDRRRRIFARKEQGWTESEIAIDLGVNRAVVKRIVDAVYLEVCEKLGLKPTPRKTRAPGRSRSKRAA
jgi:ribosome-binding protein aMBF1 (putative translation factor)